MSAKRKADDLTASAAAEAAAAPPLPAAAAAAGGAGNEGASAAPASASAAASATSASADASSADDDPHPSAPLGHDAMMEACASGRADRVVALLDAADSVAEGGGDDDENDEGDVGGGGGGGTGGVSDARGKGEGEVASDGGSERDRSGDDSGIPPRQLLASHQDHATGLSPLMVAAKHGHLKACEVLLEAGAPWNALDRRGKCAGDHATENQKWDVVEALVEAGTRAELILGASLRLAQKLEQPEDDNATIDHKGDQDQSALSKEFEETSSEPAKPPIPIAHEPCTKPDYLSHSNVRYDAAHELLLDDDGDAVMMEWERPLMEAHAKLLTGGGNQGKRVLNIGFGLGIIDGALQAYKPSLHVIVEAHPTVYNKMQEDGWDEKENVRVCFGRWQDVVPRLIDEGVEFDGIFYDTYGEHYTDMDNFHALVPRMLGKPDGVYSFFNGLAPDNLFFHGVACNCIKVQLSRLGLDVEFARCEIQVDDAAWEGVRRRYWHGREAYYLPIITWKKE